MTISVTGANQFLRSGVLKEATLVVPDKGVGALLSVTLVNQRLNRLAKVVEDAVKAADIREAKSQRDAAAANYRVAAARRAQSRFADEEDASSAGSTGTGHQWFGFGGGSSGGGGGGGHSGVLDFLEDYLGIKGISKGLKLLGKGGSKLGRLGLQAGKLGKFAKFAKFGLREIPFLGEAVTAGSILYGVSQGQGKRYAAGAGVGALVGGALGILGGPAGIVAGAAMGAGVGTGLVDFDLDKYFVSAWGSLTDTVSRKATQVKEIATQAWDSVVKTWDVGTASISHSVHTGWKNFTDAASKYATQIEDWVGRQGATLSTWFDDIVHKLREYINTFELKRIAGDWLDQLRNWLNNKFGGPGGITSINGAGAAGTDLGNQIGASLGNQIARAASRPSGGPSVTLPSGVTIGAGLNAGGPARVGKSVTLPSGVTIGSGADAGSVSAKGMNIDQMAARLKQVQPGLSNQQCVTLAYAFAGIPYTQANVLGARRGESVVGGKHGLLPTGTPVATFFNKDMTIGDRYAAGGTGTPGISRDHMGIVYGYLDKDGKPTTDPNKVESVQLLNQWSGSSPHITSYPLHSGYGEKRGDAYFSINDVAGNPMGSFNPLAVEAKAQNDATATPSATPSASGVMQNQGGGKEVLLAVGTNDWSSPSEKTQAGIMKQINDLKAKGYSPVVITPNPQVHGLPNSYNAAVAAAIATGTKYETPGKWDAGESYHIAPDEAARIRAEHPGALAVGDSNAVRLGAVQGVTGFTGQTTDFVNSNVNLPALPPTASAAASNDLPQWSPGGVILPTAAGASQFTTAAQDAIDAAHAPNSGFAASASVSPFGTLSDAGSFGVNGDSSASMKLTMEGMRRQVEGAWSPSMQNAVAPTTIDEAQGNLPSRVNGDDDVHSPAPPKDKGFHSRHWMDSIPTAPTDPGLALKTLSDNH